MAKIIQMVTVSTPANRKLIGEFHMAVVKLAKIAQTRKPESRLLGLDLGSKTIGLALSDISLLIASPLKIIKRTKFTQDAETLEALVEKHDVGGFVIGLPINLDGSEGPRCQSTRQFAMNLLERRDIPIAFWDERLSTVAVEGCVFPWVTFPWVAHRV